MRLSVHQRGVGICLPECLTRAAIFGGKAPFGALRTPKNCGVSRPGSAAEQIAAIGVGPKPLNRGQHFPLMLVKGKQ